jgi:selenocysteine lyase/cysteine desulfurase
MIQSDRPAIPHEDLLRYREEFPILHRSTYLNSCSLGALSARAEAELADFLENWHAHGASAWYEHWMGKLSALRAGVGKFTSTGGDQIALLPSTSVALAVAAESADYSQRNKVVIADLDFPTLAYQWAVKPEVEVVVVRSRDGVGVDPEQFAEVVDERTAFLATSHVFYATGYRQDIDALADIAHDAGALCLIDGYHGVGQVATDLGSTRVDMYTTGPLKWLLGGPGLSYLWASHAMIEGMEPRITSWFAHRDQFAFDLEHFVYHDDARRFEMGTPALPTVHTSLGGQAILNEVGATRVEERNAGLADYLADELEGAGFGLTRSLDPARRTAIVMVQHPDAPGAVRHLASHDITVDHRPGHVRVSPHFYNTVEELDRFVEVLAGYAA